MDDATIYGVYGDARRQCALGAEIQWIAARKGFAMTRVSLGYENNLSYMTNQSAKNNVGQA